MSAFYTVKYADRIEILTDGAHYLDDGTVTNIDTKIWQVGNLPMVFTGRGNDGAINHLRIFLQLSSFGQTFDSVLEIFRGMLADKRKDAMPPVDVILAGFSQTQGPVVYYFHSYIGQGDHFDGIEPFELHEIEREFVGGPTPSHRTMRDSGLPMFWALDDTAEHGVKFFEAMRRTPGQHLAHPDKPELYMVGGKVDHTIVTSNGVTTTCLHEWPDAVGEKIAA